MASPVVPQPCREDLFSKSSPTRLLNLDKDSKCSLINAFWPHLRLTPPNLIDEEYSDFFYFLGKTLLSLYPHLEKFAARDLQDLFLDIHTLRDRRHSTKQELIPELRQRYSNASDSDVARSMELAVRLWLGISVCSRQLIVGPRNGRDSLVEWADAHTLDQLVRSQFVPYQTRWSSRNSPLDDSFTVVNLKSICRLNIRWTDSLVDHLKLEGPRGQRSLTIYRHKISLINHRKGSDPTIIPPDVLDEALRTLDLLFPFGDPKTEAFLKDEKVQFWAVAPRELPRATETDDFHHWRNNMVALASLFNGPPETIVQTLLDTRNLPQFATLWVAIFGVFLLTILFGILTTVYSVKQYRIAIKSYELSLAVACQQTATPLPPFCTRLQ